MVAVYGYNIPLPALPPAIVSYWSGGATAATVPAIVLAKPVEVKTVDFFHCVHPDYRPAWATVEMKSAKRTMEPQLLVQPPYALLYMGLE